MKKSIFVLTMMLGASIYAATYYVDRDNPNASDAANVGTEDVPFASIQAAVDKAAAGDVVKVKPGIYDNGGKTYTFTNKAGDTLTCLDRVCITKAIRLEATSSNPADTVIKGASDPEPTNGNAFGIGPNAVRCVSVGSATGVVVKGFTLADGRAHALTAETDIPAGRPGGFAPSSSTRQTYFVDGVITNCCAARGGAVRYATVVRSLIVDNTTEGGNAPGREANFFHCIFRRNSGAFMESRVVNCTVVETPTYLLDKSDTLWNSILALPGTFTAHGDTDKRFAKNSQLPTVYNTTCDTNCFYGVDYPFVSPIRGDYRLRSGVTATTLGSMASFAEAITACGLPSSLPEGVDIYRSMDGVTLDPSGADAICAGAFQKATEVASGTLFFTRKIAVDGVPTFTTGMYAHSMEDHDHLIFTGVGDMPLFRIARTSLTGRTYYPYCDETAAVAFPPTGYVSTNDVIYAVNVLYVDPTNGVDDVEQGYGLSRAMPYRTLQYAVDRVGTGDSNRTVIYAAAGVYEEGGALSYGSNRVAILSRSIRLVGAGAGKSIIRGAYDDTSDKRAGDGRGPAAMRCVVAYNSYVAIEGFTFENGYSSYDPEKTTDSAYDYQGGLVLLLGTSSGFPRHVLECTFKGGIAYRGSALAGDSASNIGCHRCLFEDCNYLAGGMLRQVDLVSCLVRNSTGNGGRALDVGTRAYHTTIDLNSSYGGAFVPANVNTILNSVIKGVGESSDINSDYRGNVLWNMTISRTQAGCSYVKADPVFVDAANGDYRVASSSPALTASELTTDLYRIYPLDYNGKPRRFINDKPVAGAFAEPVQVVTVESSSYGTSTVTGGTTGTNFLEAGESLAVSYTSDGRRHLAGYVVDGETVTNELAQYVYTAGSGVTTAGTATIAPYFSPHWYVDANNGNDGNDGFTPQTAKRTLAEAMTNCCLLAGDMVHAAAGVYRDGTMPEGFQMRNPPVTGTRCRVSVPANVTLVADGDVADTVIEGAADSTGSHGLGAGAIRCAAVKAGGVLKGFTLTGGRTGTKASTGAGNSDVDDTLGGGAIGQGLGAVVENCTITDCYAPRGGGGAGAKFVNCRIVNNGATDTSPALYVCAAYGCFIDGNYGNGQVTRFISSAYNCTFTERNWSDTAKTTKASDYLRDYSGTLNLVNSVVCGKVYPGAGGIAATASFTNLTSAAAVGLDENYRPVKGGLAIDAGSNAGVADVLNGVDAAGTQRIYNGTVDIGCYEYDWRADYAADLGVKVPVAAPGVVEETAGQSVRLGSGELDLLFTCGDPSLATLYTIPVTVQGAGTLTATLNGEVLTNLTSAAGAANIVFRNRETSNSLVLTYDGDDTGALIAHTSLNRNSTVMIFR